MPVFDPRDPFNIESGVVWGVFNNNQDPDVQGRGRISCTAFKDVPIDKLPWCKPVSAMQTQHFSKSGGTSVTPQNFMPGDVVLVNLPTASQREYTFQGHPGTIVDSQGSSGTSTGGDQNQYKSHYPYGDAQAGVPMASGEQGQAAVYPAPGAATITNPIAAKYKVSDAADSRMHTANHIKRYPKQGGKAYQSWQQDMHITDSTAAGSPVTRVIQSEDKTYKAEAQQSDHGLQVLSRLRTEANDPPFKQHYDQSMKGAIKTIKDLMQSGSGMPGETGNIWGQFQQYAALALTTGGRQNQETAQGIMNSAVTVLANAYHANGSHVLDANGDHTSIEVIIVG